MHRSLAAAAAVLSVAWAGSTLAASQGSWSAPINWPLIGIHQVLTPDGRVLSYGADGGTNIGLAYDVWDPSKGTGAASHTTLPITTGTDIFCSSQLILPRSGDIFIAGGDTDDANGKKTNVGNNDSNIFGTSGNTLVRGNDLKRPRWYSSSVTLVNGDTYIQGGTSGEDLPEYRDANGNFRLLTGINTTSLQAPYPRNFVAPDGRVFGFDVGGRLYYIDTTGNGSITLGAHLPGTTRLTSSPVMFNQGRILQIGGPQANAYVIDINGAAPVISSTSPLSSARQWVNTTVLPDGKVLATGGSEVANELVNVNNFAEIWNPSTGQWTKDTAGQNPRLYHSNALLLPDARVIINGGGAPGPVTNLNAEIYSPPYLFQAGGQAAVRPTISSAPTALTPGQAFVVNASGASAISRITLIKTGSVTHSFNMEQRFIELPFTTAGNAFTVTPPESGSVVTPGYYLLFVLDASGVPSIGRIVFMNIGDTVITPPPPPPPPPPFTLNPLALPQPVQAGDSVAFNASITGNVAVQYSWFFDDGTPPTAPAASAATAHVFANPGVYYVTVTATASGTPPQTQTVAQMVHQPLTARAPTASSNILYEPRGNGRVWVVNQDNNSVSILNAATNARIAEVPVGARPRALARAPDGRIWVTNKDDATISVIDPVGRTVVSTVALPYASLPFGIAFSADGSAAFVVLEGTATLLKLDPSTGAEFARASVGANPRHLSIAADGSSVYVSRFISPLLPGETTANVQTSGGGQVVVVNASSMTVTDTINLHVSTLTDAENQGSGVPNYLGAAVISPDGLTAWVPSKQDEVLRGMLRNGLDLDFQNTVRAVSSRLTLATRTEDGPARIDHDNSGVASAVAYEPNGVYLFVALESSREVAVVDAYGALEILRFDAGRAPQGLVVSPDGHRLYVNNFMDRTVGVFDLDPLMLHGESNVPSIATVSMVVTEKLSAKVLKGKQFFYDARDTRMSRDRYLSCSSCHNDGGHDGRVWDFTGSGEGLRNTVALRGRAGKQGFLHWSANFDEVQDFETQIRRLASGTGLMSDAQLAVGTRSQTLGDAKAGVSADLDALAAYVESLGTFDKSPKRLTAGTLTSDAKAGRTIYAASGCSSCHAGTAFTDSGAAILHDVGTIKPSSGGRLGGPLIGIDTPTLRDVWATAPYLHDGSAATLSAAIVAHSGISVPAADLPKLVAFVEQIGSQEASAPAGTGGDTVAPSVPANFAVTKGHGQPHLSWSASTDNVGVTGYAVYRSTNGTLGSQLIRVTARNWLDASAVEGVTYTYAVKAFDAAGNLSGATPLVGILASQPPSIPASLTVTLVNARPQLQWAASTDNVGVSGYIIYRSTTGNMGPELVRTGATTYRDASAAAGTTYTYALKAYDAAGFMSARSAFVTITVP